jgi:hypothetical protein
VVFGVWAVAGGAVVRQAAQVVYTPFADVRPALQALHEILPAQLEAATASPDSSWSDWAAQHDRDIRARLAAGDEDTIVNWLLLGTSFTGRPRAFIDVPVRSGRESDRALEELSTLIAARARDLAAAIVGATAAAGDERRLFARQLFQRGGFRLDDPAERSRLEQHLLAAVIRVQSEQARFASELREAKRQRDQTDVFSVRSKLYRDRGLSLDTSIQPSFALEQSLREIKSRGWLPAGGVYRVAVIGPGLDFSDKSSGYDFYPQQTLQPFALVDSILRLGIADRASAVHLTTLDLSPRVNDHLRRAQRRAAAGSPYVARVPFDTTVPWTPEFLAFSNVVGASIGTAWNTSSPIRSLPHVRVRTIEIRPELLSRLEAVDLDIVVQRLAERKFDLVVATNVFVYYDVLDQALALANVAAMLTPGGLLLSNNAVLELPSSRLRSVGYLTTQYSGRQDDGDHVVWYRRD